MYTYTIDGTTVSPKGEWTIDFQRNEGQIFFRRIMRGDLTFAGDDYAFIMSKSDCSELAFIIYCDDVSYWTGTFKFPYSFHIDTDACIIKGTPEVEDEYSCILLNYETEYLLSPAGGAIAEIRTCGGALLDTLPIGYTILSYLTALINGATKMNCSLTLKSSFMWRDNFPNGTVYAGAYGANNYITGAANRLEYIRLWTNTSLRANFGGTLCDGSQYFTFKEFEEILRNRFNAYWYIDQNGDFRIEHIHFFDADFPESDFEDGIDLTTMTGRCLPTFASRKNKYSYLTEDLYDQEFWSWQHYDGTEGTIAHGTDFQGTPIFYGATLGAKSDCVAGEFKEKEWPTPRFWSDIWWAFQLMAAGTPDTINCPGLCMIDIDTVPAPDRVRCEVGALSTVNTINGHCSTANLMDHYFTYDRIFLTGYMNDPTSIALDTFDSEIRKQLQDEIEFPHCCTTEFDPLDFVVTEMGSGAVYSAVQSRLKNSITIKLLY